MTWNIAEAARTFEFRQGREITYAEMKCNQFVLAVIRETVDPGFPNTVADSFKDSPRFMKVSEPRAGDLVHWSGHIGIVLDPDLGTFIGSQSTPGVDEDNYKTGWWSGQHDGKKPDYFLRWIG